MTRTEAGKSSLANASTYIPEGGPSRGREPARRRTLYPILILLAWLLIYVPGLSSPPLLDDADSVHAEAAREMVVRGDYVTLHANGIRYLDKAPLPYWLTAASYRLFGVSEFSTRLPLALLVLALLFAVYRLGANVYGEEAGLYAALIIVTAAGPYIFTRFFIPDIAIGLWLALGMAFFLRSLREERPSRLTCWGFAAAAAAGVLTKGLIGMVFPLGIVFLYLLLTGNLRHLLKLRLLSSTAVFLALAAPWHVLAALRNPPQGASKGFLWFYFLNEQFYRYLDKRIPRDYDKVSLVFFYGLLLVWLFPWSVFVPQGLAEIPRKLRNYRFGLDERQKANLLFALWAGAILLFFSFSTRQEYYTIPAVPGLALLTAGWLGRESQSAPGSRLRRSGMISAGVLFGAGVAAFLVSVGLAWFAQTPPPGTDLSDLLKKNPAMYALSFGHFFDLTAQAMGMFRLPLVITGCALLLGGALCWWLRRRNAVFHSNLALAAAMCVVMFCVHLALITFLPVLGSKELAVAIQRQYRPGEIIEVDGEYTRASTVNFYTGIQLHLLNGRVNDMWYGSLFPDAPRVFDDDASFAALWRGPQRVYFITPDAARARWLETMAPAYELATSGGKYVFSNRPAPVLP